VRRDAVCVLCVPSHSSVAPRAENSETGSPDIPVGQSPSASRARSSRKAASCA
jgi:hypothetical protein